MRMKIGIFCLIVFFLMAVIVSEKNVSAKDRGFTVLALGDSTTAGTPGFLSPAEAPPDGSGDIKSQYAYWILQKHPEWTVLNRGVRGRRSDQIFNRFKRGLASAHPDVVVVLAGVNDLYQGYPAVYVEAQLKQIYELALKNDIRILACTILPYNESTPKVKQEMSRVNDWIRSYSKEHGILFCDTYVVLNDVKNPGNLAGTPDGIHPDVEGYHQMGDAIREVLEKTRTQ